MKIIFNTLKFWLPLAAAVTLLSGMVYIAVQQELRISANDPQIQLAEDGARALAEQQPPDSIVPPGKVDIAQSLAPYLIVFDSQGSPVASNAVLHGVIPDIPKGVLDYTRTHGEDRVTFMPEAGVRSATVIVSVNGGQGGFVLAGRSLREVEKRIDQLTQQVGAIWLAAMLVTLVLVLGFEVLTFRQKT
jgi:hypothetical protein